MADTKPTAPLDLSLFDNLDAPPAHRHCRLPPVAQPPVAADARLAAEPAPGAAGRDRQSQPPTIWRRRRLRLRRSISATPTTLLSHGDGVLAGIAQSSRQLLTGVRLGDAGEVGRIAASVIDGVKILRIQDLQAEAGGGQPGARKGLIGRLIRRRGRRPHGVQGLCGEPQEVSRSDGFRTGQGAQDQGGFDRCGRTSGSAGGCHTAKPAWPEDRDRGRPDRARPRPGRIGSAAAERGQDRRSGRCRRS